MNWNETFRPLPVATGNLPHIFICYCKGHEWLETIEEIIPIFNPRYKESLMYKDSFIKYKSRRCIRCNRVETTL